MKTVRIIMVMCIWALLQSTAGHAQVLDPNAPPDGVYEKINTAVRKKIPYTFVREADVMWSKRVWRTIDLREKFNHPLYYPEQKINNRSSLFDVLKTALMNGEITAYGNALMDDEFKLKMSKTELQETFVQIDSTTQQEDPNNPGTFILAPTRNELMSSDVKAYWVKEDWFFDRQRSVMDVRILGLCPMKEKKDPSSGEVVGLQPLFWVYFPECRDLFARTEVYNVKSDAERRSLDDIFWKRMFHSYIHKESNVYDRSVNSYSSGLELQYESERIKNEIFVKEHDLWHF